MTAYRTDWRIAFFMVLILSSVGCRREAGPEAKSTPVEMTLATEASRYSGLIAVADEKGFLKKAGVEVLVTIFK